MKAEWENWKVKAVQGQGLWLGLLLLGLALLLLGVRPLWQSVLTKREQALQLEHRVERLRQFATHWDGEAVQEEKRLLTANARKLEKPRPREAWLDELERTADRCQVQCLQLAPLTEKKQKGKDGEWLEVTLEGNYVQLLTFFRQWEQAHPGSWTENGTLEADGSGRKIRYNGKFHVVIKKSSKSR